MNPNCSVLFLCFCHFWFHLYQISNTSAEDDFDGLSQTIGFRPGQDSGSCSFTVLDDDIPERNETFALELILVGSGTVVSPSQALLTILENDDAFGIIGFNEVLYL